jgi:hypothetical protein
MKRLLALPVLFALAGCASTAVNMAEPRRVVGTENGVRVDAEVRGDVLGPSSNLPVFYEITNQRANPIAVADIVPVVSYDADTQTVVLTVGSEVPGAELLPRLLVIAPGEKKQYSTTARVRIAMPAATTANPTTRFPNAFQIKVNFLGDVTPFAQLVGIGERAVADAKLADQMFPLWVERNETVFTNSLPMRWVRQQMEPPGGGAQRR